MGQPFPSRCLLCGKEEESINHLFLDCNYSKKIWRHFLNISGPQPNLLGPISNVIFNWENQDHRRIIAASLVNGVYIQEKNRINRGEQPKTLAPPWWEYFNFELVRPIRDDNCSIFAAIYKFNLPPVGCSSPKYVIAFRGTINSTNCSLDFGKNIQLVRNNFHRASRCEIGVEEVSNLVDADEGSTIWIVGHSLGSSVGLHVGKTMAIKGIRLETFLFNPPHISISVPIQWIESETIKSVIHISRSIFKAGFVKLLRSKSQRQNTEVKFLEACEWLPSLFVHRDDVICSKYIEYFEGRDVMEKLGLGEQERLAMQHTRRCLFLHKPGPEYEPSHLIPSARLITNQTRLLPNKAHGLKQWWSSEMTLLSKEYIFGNPNASES
ncbi:hypothetical protein ACHQM5_004328 [Ranunculus cassubicifolius]